MVAPKYYGKLKVYVSTAEVNLSEAFLAQSVLTASPKRIINASSLAHKKRMSFSMRAGLPYSLIHYQRACLYLAY